MPNPFHFLPKGSFEKLDPKIQKDIINSFKGDSESEVNKRRKFRIFLVIFFVSIFPIIGFSQNPLLSVIGLVLIVWGAKNYIYQETSYMHSIASGRGMLPPSRRIEVTGSAVMIYGAVKILLGAFLIIVFGFGFGLWMFD